jgi:hypothetical protein
MGIVRISETLLLPFLVYNTVVLLPRNATGQQRSQLGGETGETQREWALAVRLGYGLAERGASAQV